MIKVKTRPTVADLPAGYQFGDARPVQWRILGAWHCPKCRTLATIKDRVVYPACVCGALQSPTYSAPQRWRPPHENAAERTSRYQQEFESREGDTAVLADGGQA